MAEADWSRIPAFEDMVQRGVDYPDRKLQGRCRRIIEAVVERHREGALATTAGKLPLLEWIELSLKLGDYRDAYSQLDAGRCSDGYTTFLTHFESRASPLVLEYAREIGPASTGTDGEHAGHLWKQVSTQTKAAGVAALGLFALGSVLSLGGDPRRLETALVENVGPHLEVPGRATVRWINYDESLPDVDLPPMGSEINTACVVRREGHDDYLAVGTYYGGQEPGVVGLWNPFTASFAWKSRWSPPAVEHRMHEHQEDPDAPFGVRFLFHGSLHGNMGNLLGAQYMQRGSACYVVFWDLDAGEVVRSYAHPGHLSEFDLVDLDGDGALEVLCGGMDNTRTGRGDHEGRPVLVILDPLTADGAASTVLWNQDGEAALMRFLFPDFRSWKDLVTAGNVPPMPQMGVFSLDSHAWDPTRRIYSLKVGRSPYEECYRVRLDMSNWPEVDATLSPAHPDQWAVIVEDVEEKRCELESRIEGVGTLLSSSGGHR